LRHGGREPNPASLSVAARVPFLIDFGNPSLFRIMEKCSPFRTTASLGVLGFQQTAPPPTSAGASLVSFAFRPRRELGSSIPSPRGQSGRDDLHFLPPLFFVDIYSRARRVPFLLSFILMRRGFPSLQALGHLFASPRRVGLGILSTASTKTFCPFLPPPLFPFFAGDSGRGFSLFELGLAQSGPFFGRFPP